jgi:hypothetical protein
MNAAFILMNYNLIKPNSFLPIHSSSLFIFLSSSYSLPYSLSYSLFFFIPFFLTDLSNLKQFIVISALLLIVY